VQFRSPRHGTIILTSFGNNAHIDRYQVGHTGILDAAVKAISATDKAVGTIYDACEEAGYILLITADHGNAEQMLNIETGNPHTAHTTN
jgi:2,3-bisphosphoglycerate-independent phosphoglycerate mutase